MSEGSDFKSVKPKKEIHVDTRHGAGAHSPHVRVVNLVEADVELADLVVEILSPGTRKTDETIKRKLYERFDVLE